ncbi:MAG: flagellar hook-basal body complex protein FliE [Terriglobales bacterium]|jgi:flagellar hook-basal body complex protein FliE
MNNAISPIRILPADIAQPGSTGASSAAAGGGAGESDFLSTLQESMNAVEGAQGEAQSQVAQLLTGQGADVHSAMIAVEKADLSFQLMMQVRNKIVQAYQQISSMQF